MKKMHTLTAFEGAYTESLELENLFLSKATTTRAVAKDSASLDQVIFEGHDLKYHAGVIDSGTIDKLTLANEDGKVLQVFSHLHLNAGTFGGDTMLEFAVSLAERVASQDLKFVGFNGADTFFATPGNDKQFGRGGNDNLSGGGGHDVLVGGAGSDVFVFNEGFDKDVIVDFDAEGGMGLQDFINADFPGESSIHRSGHDTIIDFGHGDTLTLLNVQPGQIDESDFLTV